MDDYSLEAGRAIRRNGKPFVSLARFSDPTQAFYVNPTDADTFARFVALAPEALTLCHALLDNSDVRYFISQKLGEQATLHRALNLARNAVACLPKPQEV
jgi:hypothetical protein